MKALFCSTAWANKNITLKTSLPARADRDDFVTCYRADDRGKRDESLDGSDNLPTPDLLTASTVEGMRQN